MQYHEISRGTVSKMVPTGTPAYFYKSPHGATITFMGLKEKIAEGRRDIKYEETEKERGKFTNQTELKGKR